MLPLAIMFERLLRGCPNEWPVRTKRAQNRKDAFCLTRDDALASRFDIDRDRSLFQERYLSNPITEELLVKQSLAIVIAAGLSLATLDAFAQPTDTANTKAAKELHG